MEQPKIVFSTNNLMAHQHAVLAGYGIGLIAHCAVKRGDHLQRVLPEVEKVQDLWLVAHEDLKKSARVRVAFDYLADSLLNDHNHFRYGSDSVFPHPHFVMHEIEEEKAEKLRTSAA